MKKMDLWKYGKENKRGGSFIIFKINANTYIAFFFTVKRRTFVYIYITASTIIILKRASLQKHYYNTMTFS